MRTATKDVSCLLASRDPALVDTVQASALALGVSVAVVGERDDLRLLWSTADVRLVGPDMAPRVMDLGSFGGETWVVGQAGEALLSASAELGAPALALPHASARLAEVLSRQRDPRPVATVVALVGGSGGVGTSSLAVAAAVLAARRGHGAAVVELAHCGGGIDLLMGLETLPGVRWSDLANASGELGSLSEQLVRGAGVSVLSLGRESDRAPTRGAVQAVQRGLVRSHDLVVVDAGDGRHIEWLGGAQPVLLVAANVRGVAAARMTAGAVGVFGVQLLVRTGPGCPLPAAAVADALGLPLAGTIRHDPAVPKLTAAGVAPTAAPARRFRRDVNRWLGAVLP